MLLGQYEHTVDAKGRINFPAKLREDLGGSFILTQGLDNCIAVYSFEEWKLLEEKIKNQPLAKARKIQRFFFAKAVTVEPDKQGRILIPNHLREYAGLDKDVIVVGVSERAEIWDKASWEAFTEELSSDSIAEAMDDMDV